jgi:competence protein ComEA
MTASYDRPVKKGPCKLPLDSHRFTIVPAIVLSAALALVGMAQDAADLPEGPGKAAVVKFCDNCHGLEKFAAARKSKSDWDSVINQMTDEGLELTDDEYETVIGYLSKYLGKVNVNQATAAELAARLEISTSEAEAIVKFRERHGAFKEWREIAQVDGVDARKIEAKKDMIDL